MKNDRGKQHSVPPLEKVRGHVPPYSRGSTVYVD